MSKRPRSAPNLRKCATARVIMQVLLLFALALSAGFGACASPVPGRTPPATRVASPQGTRSPELSAEQRAKLFDEVWTTVQKHYLYADFRGVNWESLRAEYRPRATAARDSTAFYATVSEMVSRLKDDHSRYIGPSDARQEDALVSGKGSYVGIGVVTAPRPGSLVVQYVLAASPAERAGLRRRDRILAVDGLSPPTPALLRGTGGTSVQLLVKSPGERAHVVRVERGPVPTKIDPVVYRLPSNPSVAYVYIPSLWPEDTARLVETDLEQLLAGGGISAVVLDLRGNGGGWRQSLEGLLSSFAPGRAGSFYTRASSYPLTVKPDRLYPKLSRLKLAVLVDRDTASYAEVLAAVLQSQGRAVVVGDRTAGNTETVYEYNLADGSRLWLAQEGFRLIDGTNLEGRGVVPDAELQVDWTLYPEAEDPMILRALELMKLR